MIKFAAMVTSLLVSLGLAAFLPAQPPGPDGPEPPKAKAKGKEAAKKKGEPGPGGDLTKAYNLLRSLRASDSSVGRPEERIREWTERATKYYRDGLKALDAGDDFLAHEYGAIAHDLARATDHARNAALFDRRDPELPSPSNGFGPEDSGERVRRDLYHAYERIAEFSRSDPVPGVAYYLKASRDLYTAARRDVEAGRDERGGELARAAEAMTHVAEHLGHVAAGPPEARGKIAARSGGFREPLPPPDRPDPKAERLERRDDGLPPSLPPE